MRFDHPAAWRPATIDQRHLFLAADNGAPAMEIKWGPGAGDLDRPIDALAASLPRRGARLERRPLAPAWQEALGERTAQGFSWHANGSRARGVAISCPQCGTTTLLQFLAATDHEATAVIASLDDHHHGPWRLFDLTFQPPAGARLGDFRFEAGSFAINFTLGRGETLRYARLAPADHLLAQQDLTAWAQKVMAADHARPLDEDRVGWQWSAPPLAAFWRRLRGRPAHRAGAMWTTNNRILALALASRRPITGRMMDRLRADFTVETT